MSFNLPGPESLKILKKGPSLFKYGAEYEDMVKAAEKQGQKAPPQMINARGEGSYVIDADGNRIIDFHSGWASNPLGNANPEIVETVYAALKQYGFIYEHRLRYDLAEVLAGISPGGKLTRTNFEISGTEAAEAAVTYALKHTGRPLIIAFENQFHGDSIATRMLGSNRGAHRRKGFEAWRGGVITVPWPISYNIPAGMTFEQYTDYVLWYIDTFVCEKVADPESIAGIIAEPLLSEGGNWMPHPKFMPGLKKLCEKYGWVFISDEVLSGMGRSGKWWAIEHDGVSPDLVVIGKHLTGGIEPIAAVIGTEEVLAHNDGHSGSTFAGTPAGCAAALKTIEIMKRDNLVPRADTLGKKCLERMRKWEKEFSIIGQARGRGFLLGATVVEKTTGKPDIGVALAVVNEALKRGAWLIWDTEPQFRLYPAMNIDEEVLEKGLTITEESIREVELHYTPSDYPFWTTGILW
ncbi:MAG: aminotransferase class III-fold pyridoxal phosphate-dependent enzyme [Spirochaetales bacterium]|nr:aminotransferase class III-fold pyridoxal phosphate-dependent enzyme [Spirochaetales bacterium]